MNKLIATVIAVLTLAACSDEDPTEGVGTDSAQRDSPNVEDMKPQASSTDAEPQTDATSLVQIVSRQNPYEFVYVRDVLPARHVEDLKGGR